MQKFLGVIPKFLMKIPTKIPRKNHGKSPQKFYKKSCKVPTKITLKSPQNSLQISPKSLKFSPNSLFQVLTWALMPPPQR